MTYLSAASIMIDTFGRKAASSLNPEMDMALRAQAEARSGGLMGWLRRTAVGKALIARQTARDMDLAFDRLASTSPHLLADIGLLDIAADAEIDPIHASAPANELRAAPVPVALRPALRPAIVTTQRAPAAAPAKVPARAARKEQPVAQ